MHIIQKRTAVEYIEYFLSFDRIGSPGSGFMFPCDINGIMEPLEGAAKESFKDAQNTELYYPPCIRGSRHTQRLPAIGRCECGDTVQLADPLTNECKCGRAYNMGGQEIKPNYSREDCVLDGCAWDETDY